MKFPRYWHDWQVSQHKHIEVQFDYFSGSVGVSFDLQYTTKRNDHAGLRCSIAICGVYLETSFYDNRHADQR